MPVCPTCTAEFHGEEQFCPRDGTPLQLPTGGDRLVGRVLSGRYRLLSQLGQGGMGSVYRAHHILMDKPVAVKVLRQELASNGEAVARFHREARSASKLDHEHVIRVTDFGQSDDALLFLVMELLDGESLAQVVQRGRLPWRRAVEIARDVALGLAHAHEQGVVHRDLKPENILLARRGRSGKPLVKVLDFGLAKLMHEAWTDEDGMGSAKKPLTRTGVVFGTPEYMSPEQAEAKDLDYRTDIYGLGVLCYQMVTGAVPFTGATLLALITKVVQDAPEPPTQRVPGLDVPPELEALILRCLEKEPAARPQSVDEVLAELERICAAYPDCEARSAAVSDPPGLRPAVSSQPSVVSGAHAARLAVSQPPHGAPLHLPIAEDEVELVPPPGGLAVAPTLVAAPVGAVAALLPAAADGGAPDPVSVAEGRQRQRRGLWLVLSVALAGGGVGAVYLARGRSEAVTSGAQQPAAQRDLLTGAQQLLDQHRPDDALAVLGAARQQGNSPALQRLLSGAHELKSNRLQALGHMYTALSLSRGTPEALATQSALAQLLTRLGHGHEACRVTGDLLAAHPEAVLRQRAEALSRTLHCKHKS